MIVGATTLDGERVVFDRRARERMQDGAIVTAVPGARIEEGAIVGTLNGDPQTVPIAELSEIRIAEHGISTIRTVIFVPIMGFLIFYFGAVFVAAGNGCCF